ncbi:MAG: flagellar biosynthesis anti-sigma factor FlgM [Dehalococcoidia bacterium]
MTPTPAGDGEGPEPRLDRIELSPEAREISAEPDAAREALLAALRARIDAGTYRIDASGVARRIVNREDL